ncbi:DNA repair protein RecO [Limnobacter parvus]|uniref:DNA repair protein RecO n=1 Tax=Limnobacter parvus TaxID=2939690 RepID=A0ABT1XJ43_9BURK|nr:DNA repair protein RecO [Limnobacter parvus]MCR2746919.1 DNA repair protein RecO [Limnobacter parvus]
MNNPRSNSDLAYVLHSVPYKETSLIVELFCKEHGRMPVVAKGAKRPHSGLRAVLVSFQPLSVRFTGKSDVKTLTQAEWMGGLMSPDGKALFAAYYLNELLMRGLGREDNHPELFDLYQQTLIGLVAGEDMNVCIRRFEVGLLQALGYGFDWQFDAQGRDIESDSAYVWQDQVGWTTSNGLNVGNLQNGLVEQMVQGHWMVEIQQGLWSKAAASALKPITRRLLLAHVAPNGLMSRVWMEHLLRHD